jgi:predicted 3-demethylubiquinone-9 3-methyltransferase (glyoxalase superfamily)
MASRISVCLWFDTQAEEAANFYCTIFPNSRVTDVARYSEVGKEIHGGKEGQVMAVKFQLDGQPFEGINGGPIFKFTEAMSLPIDCRDQKEIDYYWEKLGAGGDPKAQQCGWLKDKYGVSWQVVWPKLFEMIKDPKSEAGKRAMDAMLKMKKLDIAALERAYAGD